MTAPATSAASLSNASRLEAKVRPTLTWRRILHAPGLLPLATFVVILVVWETACRVFAIPSFVLPAPSRIIEGFGAVPLGRWVEHVWATLRVALIGFFVSIAISLPIAVGLARSQTLSRALYPILVVIQATPIVAVAPIIMVVLGAGDLPRVFMTCLITFFPLVVSTATGLMATPPELIELSRSLRAPLYREITQIRLPYAIPFIFSALRIASTLAVIGAVVAEFVAAERGLGYFIQFSTSMFQIQQAWSGLVVLVILSLALFQAVNIAQRLLFPWSLPESGR